MIEETAKPLDKFAEMEKRKGLGTALYLLNVIFGIILPVVTVGIEISCRICSSTFFDPMPTALHAIVILLVPISSVLLLRGFKAENFTRPQLLLFCSGLSCGISAIYFAPFAPLILFWALLTIWFGLGLLPLAPLFSFLLNIGNLFALKKLSGWMWSRVMPVFLSGLLGGLCLVVSTELSPTWTRGYMKMACSNEPDRARAGIRLLRAFGNEDIMRRECYSRTHSMSELLASYFKIYDYRTKEKARLIYYRTFGKSFNRGDIPWTAGWIPNDDWRGSFDVDLAGSEVGFKNTNIWMSASDMNMQLEPKAGLAKIDWTFQFSNKGKQQEEARMLLNLPDNAVVSDVVLWVNDSPRSAVFGERSKVKLAYQQVVARKMDPILVTNAGPGKVLVQCFPVPPAGQIKAKLTITEPVYKTSQEDTLTLPEICEANFNLDGTTNLETNQPVPLRIEGEHLNKVSADDNGLTTSIATQNLGSCLIRSVPQQENEVWCSDPQNDRMLIRRKVARNLNTEVPNLLIVIDGSESMLQYREAIAAALKNCPKELKAKVLFASDEISKLSPEHSKDTLNDVSEAASTLNMAPFVGGPNNVDSLLKALDWQNKDPHREILWIHAPQQLLPDFSYEIESAFSGLSGRPKIFEFQCKAGPSLINGVIEKYVSVKSVHNDGKIDTSINRFLQDLATPKSTNLSYERNASGNGENSSLKVSSSMAALWARQELNRLLDEGKLGDAAKIGSHYRIVSPVSGAVVLERDRQYKDAGLNPTDPDANAKAPQVGVAPEAETWLLLLVLMLAALIRFEKQWRRGGGTFFRSLPG